MIDGNEYKNGATPSQNEDGGGNIFNKATEPSEDNDQNTVLPLGSGRLIVRVFTASGAVPLSGAQVVVRNTPMKGGGIIASLTTDRSGIAPATNLPAPPKAEAQRPGGELPFSVYGIDVFLNGYYRSVFESVPIYDGITSVQNAGMIPLPENGRPDGRRPDDTIIYPESRDPSL